MFKKVLVDLHAEIELPVHRWIKDIEERAEHLEYEARDLTEFLRDHRSRDSYQIHIIREYESVCEFCGYEEERDEEGCPVCCKRAIDEWQSLKQREGVEK